LFNIAYLIYGNVLVYNDAYECKNGSDGAVTLWRLMLSLVVIGYLTFFACYIIGCCSVCMCLALCGVMKSEKAEGAKKFMPFSKLLGARQQ
jgi:hypothetical protein